jgi:hypothetical protein
MRIETYHMTLRSIYNKIKQFMVIEYTYSYKGEFMKRNRYLLFLLILAFLLTTTMFGCGRSAPAQQDTSTSDTLSTSSPATDEPATASTAETTAPATTSPLTEIQAPESSFIIYKNTTYGFNLKLPSTWKDYSIIPTTWDGLSLVDGQGDKISDTGPVVSIRNPAWTKENPMQDIPIMVFTNSQWEALQREEFHIGAAPIGPSELGHNSKYVFALPARYNFSFLTGYEEVQKIIDSKPLETNEDFS